MSWRSLFASHILERGESYADNDAVSNLTVEDNCISADVQGTDIYHVEIELDQGTVVDMNCSCMHAAGGYHCKHMAAVLSVYEQSLEDTEEAMEISEAQKAFNAAKTLVEKIPAADLRQIIVDCVLESEAVKNRLQNQYDFHVDDRKMADLKRQVKAITRRYAGRDWFVDWEHADDYISELQNFQDSNVPVFLEHGCYMEAFELVNHVFHEVSAVDMDDSDGGTSMIAEVCYEYWKRILAYCSADDRKLMKKWFATYKSNGYFIDYMEEYLQEFYEEYLLSNEEMHEKLAELDALIESKRDMNSSGMLYSASSGGCEAVLKRIEYMRKLNMSEEEIRQYQIEHRHFHVIRMLEIQDALQNNDEIRAIQILRESKNKDVENKKWLKEESQKLIELYANQGMKTEYREELLFQIRECQQTDLTYYHMLKESEMNHPYWSIMREYIIHSVDDIGYKCSILKEEKEYERLMAEIEQKNNVYLLDEYADVLRDAYPEKVIRMYTTYVIPKMEPVSDRTVYRYLTGYLRKIELCRDGRSAAVMIADMWKEKYNRRRAMIDELRKAGF